MTKIYAKKRQTVEVVQGVTCDWCGVAIIDDVEQCEGSYPDTDISCTIFSPCYESGDGRRWAVEDLCIKCVDRLKILLKESGVNVTESEFHW